MTLKSWLSSNNVHSPRSKMSPGVSIFSISKALDSPTEECGLGPTSCGALKVRKNKGWKTRSVENVLDTSLEQGDYGFVEYFSSRQGKNVQNSTDVELNRLKRNSINSWKNYGSAQFYPGTLNRPDNLSRKRSRKDRTQDQPSKVLFNKSNDLRTSTPMSNLTYFNQKVTHFMPAKDNLDIKPTILKRNSVLSKLKPEKWKENNLRRSRSRDDFLGSQKNSGLCASQPDLLTSHNASAAHFESKMVPAPISILPPTHRLDPLNVTQTLPRQRSSSDAVRNNTLFARGKRWLTGSTNKENDLNCSNQYVLTAEYHDKKLFRTPTEKNYKPNLSATEPKLTRGATFSGEKPIPRYTKNVGNPLEQMRCRRPLTFYLLEDYLSPVESVKRMEIDDSEERSPRTLFRNQNSYKPKPPTPDWDMTSLSPQSSIFSSFSSRTENINNSTINDTPSKSFDALKLYEDSSPKSFQEKRIKNDDYSPMSLRRECSMLPPHYLPRKDSFLRTDYKNIRNRRTLDFSSDYKVLDNIKNTSFKRYNNYCSSASIQDSIVSSPIPNNFSQILSPRSSRTSYRHIQRFSPPNYLASLQNIKNHSNNSKLLTEDKSSPYVRKFNQNFAQNVDAEKNIRSSNYEFLKAPGQHSKDLFNERKRLAYQLEQKNGSLNSAQKLPALTNPTGSTSNSRLTVPFPVSRNGLSDTDLTTLQTDLQSSIQSSHSLKESPPTINNNGKQLLDTQANSDVSMSPDRAGYIRPMTQKEALRLYGDYLTAFEKKEITSYPEIWYLGLDSRKIHGDENSSHLNGGFDDDNGSYNKVMHDHISYRYEILEVIGKGSFGQVIRAIDHRSGEQVAIKIIRNKKRFHHQALVEVKILDHLRRKDKRRNNNVIRMFDYFYFRNHLCITFELMGLNLYELIKKNSYQGFGLGVIKRFAQSLVQCLSFLAKENIIHCDLKPENVLLKERGNSTIRVIDFGSSCYDHQKVYTYIQSRFYRSPEIILGLPYSAAIDMWSLGCILAELYTGYPLFPGENEVEQLACIMEVIGSPPYSVLCNASRRRLFFDSKGQPRCVANSKGKKRRPGSRDISSVLKCSDPTFVDFISNCLDWDSSQRLKPSQALQHEWLVSDHSPMPSSPAKPQSGSPQPASQQSGSRRLLEPSTAKESEAFFLSAAYRVYKNKKGENLCAEPKENNSQTSPKIATVEQRSQNDSDSRNIRKELFSDHSKIVKKNTFPRFDVPPRNVIGTDCTFKNQEIADNKLESSLDDSGTYLPPIL